MRYKDRLGISSDDGYIFSKEIDEYFESFGFYRSTMNPRFMDGNYYNELELGDSCLRFDGDWEYGGTQRVFMNRTEIYVERQTSYRSFDSSSYLRFTYEPLDISDIEGELDYLVN